MLSSDEACKHGLDLYDIIKQHKTIEMKLKENTHISFPIVLLCFFQYGPTMQQSGSFMKKIHLQGGLYQKTEIRASDEVICSP